MSQKDIVDDEYSANPLRPYANRILKCSVVGANNIAQLLNGALAREVWRQLVFEYIYFYIALTAAYTANHLSVTRKQEVVESLVNLLIPRVVDHVCDVSNDIQARGLKDRHVKMTIARVRVYYDYKKLLPNAERSLRGTGAESLCTTVAELIGHRGNPLVQNACFNQLAESAEFLELKSLVNSVK